MSAASYHVLAQTTDQGPIPVFSGTEKEVRDEYRKRMRLLTTHGVGGYYAPEVRGFAIQVPWKRSNQQRGAEEAEELDGLMALLGGATDTRAVANDLESAAQLRMETIR